MKSKILAIAAATALALGATLSLASPSAFAGQPSSDATSSPQWLGASDIAVAENIAATQVTRTNASGPKITSNAHSADFPGIYFIWDSKQKDNGFLKVDASVFKDYASFTLTSKESSTYWDFVIAPQPGQEETSDGCYVFFIPKIYNNKNINMVFVSNWVAQDAPVVNAPAGDPIMIGMIGHYVDSTGQVRSPNIDGAWIELQPGQCFNEDTWAYIQAQYDQYEAKGGLSYGDSPTWVTSGYESFSFADGATDVCYANFTAGQWEGYQGGFWIDPWYVLSEDQQATLVSYDRYLADVHLWNDLYTNDPVHNPQDAILSSEGGLRHYQALLAAYGAESLPPYYHFDFESKAVYDSWADQLEVGLRDVVGADKVADNWATFGSTDFPEPSLTP